LAGIFTAANANAVYFQPDGFINAAARQRQNLHGGLWRKGVKLISQAKKNSEIFKKYIGILALLLPTIYANLRKIVQRKKSYEVLNFFLHGALWAKNG